MKTIFEPVQLGMLTLKNRLIRSATSQAMSTSLKYDPNRLYKVYSDMAKGGVGAIVTSFPLVDQDYYKDSESTDNKEKVHKKLTDICHLENCPVIAQLVLVNYEGVMDIDRMTAGDIKAVEKMFVAAAKRAAAAGYDGVQLHVAHGLFLSRFISPAYNQRKDEYGGSQQKRSRLILEIISKIKAEVPSLHLSMKINHSDEMPAGLTETQSLEICRFCTGAGIESIEVSGNGSSASGIRAGINESYYKDFAMKLADEVSVPVILVGGNRSLQSMERVLNEGNIEFMSLSRPLIREPDLPNRWISGDITPAKCVSCNMCYQTPWQECIFNLKERERK